LNVVLTGPGALANNAFDNFTRLAGITIGEGVTGVGEDSFDGCVNLASITVDEANADYASVDGVLFDKDKETLIYYPQARAGSYAVPQGVTVIEGYAFEQCKGLTSITIPPGVTSIGGGAFSGCTGLTSITIPPGVTSIGGSAFSGCTGLTSVTIPETVTSIGGHGMSSGSTGSGATSFTIYRGAFEGCSGLTSVTIGANAAANFAGIFIGYKNLSLTITGTGIVPASAFSPRTFTDGLKSDCSRITSVTIEDGVTGIGWYAFSKCTGFTSVTIPSSADIGEGAFSNCAGLASVIIEDGVPSIGRYAFYKCTGLTSVSIGYGVTGIGNYAFSECTGLTSVSLPNSVAVIGEGAFDNCTGLTSIFIPNSLVLQNSDTLCIDGVSAIKPYAFAGCDNLTSVTFGGRGIFDHDMYELQKLLNAIGMLFDLTNPIKTIRNAYGIILDAQNDSLGAKYDAGFYDNAFPQGSSGRGNALKTAYLAGGAGTYTRAAGGSVWTKQ
jgi:hypothetical protein